MSKLKSLIGYDDSLITIVVKETKIINKIASIVKLTLGNTKLTIHYGTLGSMPFVLLEEEQNIKSTRRYLVSILTIDTYNKYGRSSLIHKSSKCSRIVFLFRDSIYDRIELEINKHQSKTEYLQRVSEFKSHVLQCLS